MLRPDSITPLGLPVVPPVPGIIARSSIGRHVDTVVVVKPSSQLLERRRERHSASRQTSGSAWAVRRASSRPSAQRRCGRSAALQSNCVEDELVLGRLVARVDRTPDRSRRATCRTRRRTRCGSLPDRIATLSPGGDARAVEPARDAMAEPLHLARRRGPRLHRQARRVGAQRGALVEIVDQAHGRSPRADGSRAIAPAVMLSRARSGSVLRPGRSCAACRAARDGRTPGSPRQSPRAWAPAAAAMRRGIGLQQAGLLVVAVAVDDAVRAPQRTRGMDRVDRLVDARVLARRHGVHHAGGGLRQRGVAVVGASCLRSPSARGHDLRHALHQRRGRSTPPSTLTLATRGSRLNHTGCEVPPHGSAERGLVLAGNDEVCTGRHRADARRTCSAPGSRPWPSRR